MSLSHFRHPFDIGKHPSFEPEVKRAILASWRSGHAFAEQRSGRGPLPGTGRTIAVDDGPGARKSFDR